MTKRPEIRLLTIIVIVFICATAVQPRFAQGQALQSILLWIPLLSIMAVGQMFVIASRGIDVSIGSILGFTGIAVGLLFKSHPDLNLFVGFAVAISIGAFLGLINGALVAFAEIPPIITTLGTLSIYRGFAFLICKGDQIDGNYIPNQITNWSLSGPVRLGEVTIPWLIIFAFVAAIIGQFAARSTSLGRNVFAIGSNPAAAHLRGVPVALTTVVAYSFCGAMAGIAGILYMSRYGFVNPASAGQGIELSVIAAAVIGGCDVRGGRGTVSGVMLGCLLLGILNVALSVIGIAADWQMLVYGLTIVLSLCANAIAARKSVRT